MSASPKISVIMALYNAAGEIGGALASLRAQSFADWELLIVDDASDDDTFAVAQALTNGDPRVRLQRLARNVGPGGARNVGLAAARGEWITVLDGDDAFEPDRLQVLLDRALRDDLDLIADNLTLYDEAAARSLGPGFALGAETCALTPQRLVANDCPPGMMVLGQLKPFVRRSFLLATGVLYPEDLRVGEDFQFLFDLLERTGRAAFVDYCGYRYTLPFSPTAHRQSPGTRTSHGGPGLADLARGTQRLIDRASRYDKPDRRLIALLQRRKRRLRDEALWRRMRSRVRAHEYLGAIGLLAKLDPRFGWAQAMAIYNRRRGRFAARLR